MDKQANLRIFIIHYSIFFLIKKNDKVGEKALSNKILDDMRDVMMTGTHQLVVKLLYGSGLRIITGHPVFSLYASYMLNTPEHPSFFCLR